MYILSINLILNHTKQNHITKNTPNKIIITQPINHIINHTQKLIHILINTTPSHILKIHNPNQFLTIHTIFIHNKTTQIKQHNHTPTKIQYLLNNILYHITQTKNHYTFTFKQLTSHLKHLINKIYFPIPNNLKTNQKSPPTQSFSNQNSLKTINQFTILTKKITNFTTTHTNITNQYIFIKTNITIKFTHKHLTKTHNLIIQFTFKIKIRPTLTTPNKNNNK